MNDEWHSKRINNKSVVKQLPGILLSPILNNTRYNWDVTEAWSTARGQYDYVSNPDNGIVSAIVPVSKYTIYDAATTKDIQVGDLMYWFKPGKSYPHHATIVSKIENGRIYYSGHTSERMDADLNLFIGDETVRIIKISDNA